MAMLLSMLVMSGPGAVATQPSLVRPADRIMIVGDSISQGSSGDYTWRYRLWNGIKAVRPTGVSLVGVRDDLFDNVGSVPGSHYYAAAFEQPSHAAQWGSTFAAENPRIAERVRATGATVVLVQLGTNDLTYTLSPQQAVAAADEMIANIRSADPEVDIVFGEVPNAYNQFTGAYRLVAEGAAYAEGIRNLAAIRSTATSQVVVADTRTGWDAARVTYDGTHPNPAGEGLLAAAYLRALNALSVIASVPAVPTDPTWGVAAPAPTLVAGNERIGISWSRVSTGATAMYIRYRFNASGSWSDWNELPYPVGGDRGDAWDLAPLGGGARYEVSLKPLKYSMAGQWGPASSVYLAGTAPAKVTGVVGTPVSGGVRVSWTAAAGATGYFVRWAYITDPARGPMNWSELPGAVLGTSATVRTLPGRYVVVAVQSVRGFVRAPAVQARAVRVPGVASGAVQVFLGDGLAAGGADASATNPCGRAANGVSSLVLPTRTVRSYMFACTGSTSTQMLAPVSSNARTGQLDRAVAALKTTQNATAPRRVYLSIGRNDLHLSDKVRRCLLYNCALSESTWSAEIAALEPKLVSAFAKVRAAFPYADIYLLGYPSAISETPTRTANTVCSGLTAAEGAMMWRLSQRFALLQQRVANRYGIWANPATVTSGFRGHEMCGRSTGWLRYPGRAPTGTEVWAGQPNAEGNRQLGRITETYLLAR